MSLLRTSGDAYRCKHSSKIAFVDFLSIQSPESIAYFHKRSPEFQSFGREEICHVPRRYRDTDRGGAAPGFSSMGAPQSKSMHAKELNFEERP
jgi:hypothetical protein